MAKVKIALVKTDAGRAEFKPKEHLDCTVRACAIAFDKPYKDVWDFFHKNKIRTENSVVNNFDWEFYKNKAKFTKKFNVGFWEEKRFKTVNQLIKGDPHGTYLIRVYGHLSCIKAGQVYDLAAGNWHIKQAWRITDLSKFKNKANVKNEKTNA